MGLAVGEGDVEGVGITVFVPVGRGVARTTMVTGVAVGKKVEVETGVVVWVAVKVAVSVPDGKVGV